MVVVLEIGADANGKRRQVWRSGFATRREAQDALQAEIHHRQEGRGVNAKQVSVAAFLTEQWLPAVTRIRPSTRRNYEGHIRCHLVPAIGGRQLRDLSTPDVNRMAADLSRPVTAGGKGLHPSTVRRVHATLRSALSDAVRWGLLHYNVAIGAELPRAKRQEMHVWTAAELRRFLEFAAEDDLRPVYEFLARTGLRRGEAVGLRWKQVDLVAGRLSVNHQLVDIGYHVQGGEPKTGKGHRTISLTRRRWPC